MIQALIAVVLAALLFAVFGLVRLRPGCGGDCAGCDLGCGVKHAARGRDERAGSGDWSVLRLHSSEVGHEVE